MLRRFFSLFGLCGALVMGSCASKGKTAADSEPAPGDTLTNVKHPAWSRNAVIYEVNLRQYSDSGNVTSFGRELPRLKELGVDILWFMPVHPISAKDRKGTLGSYYAVADYKAFNPEFGTLDEFKEVVRKAHGLGLKVLIDWVPNHTGRDNVWIAQHPDWYKKDADGNMVGVYDWTDVYVLDYANKELRAGMVDAMKFWLGEVDVDGFRCDVASEVPTDFWAEAYPQLQAVKGEVFMLAEASKPELQRDGFDMGYNWPMKDLFSAIAATSGQYTFKDKNGEVRGFAVKHAADIFDLLDSQARDYPKDTYLMNMVTNHDLNSWEGTEFDRLGNLADAFAVLSYTLPGMPLIYTGQETGMNRAFEFFEKDKAPEWEPRNRYFEFYQTLNTLKHTQHALAAGTEGGELKPYAVSDENVIVFGREKGKSRVVVMANLGSGSADVRFVDAAPDMEGLYQYMGQNPAEGLPGSLAPGEYKVFVTESNR